MGERWAVRGIRGATTVEANEREAIIHATRELVERMLAVNEIATEDIASVIFTVTPDLNQEFPAVGGREAGLGNVPLLCATEIDVPGATPRCIRVLMHVNTTKAQHELLDVYLRGASSLRPDLERRVTQ